MNLLRRLLCLIGLFSAAAAPILAVDNETKEARHAAVVALQPVMTQALKGGMFNQARELAQQSITWEPKEPVHRYNLACIEARAGRPEAAFDALDAAVSLGFAEGAAADVDDDLASLRVLPRWRTLRARMDTKPTAAMLPELAASTMDAAQPVVAAAALKPAAASASAAVPESARRGAPIFRDGRPSGVFLMTRYWFATSSLEILAWYFADDGTAYRAIETGLSQQDLAGHKGGTGRCRVTGDTLEIAWDDGTTTSSTLERSDTGFSWDAGIFVRATPMPSDSSRIQGVYEGGASSSSGGNRASSVQALELRADGSYQRSGLGSISSTTAESQVSGGASSAVETGRWHAEDYSLVLTDRAGQTTRMISFPYDDGSTPVFPDRLLYGGIMLKKAKE